MNIKLIRLLSSLDTEWEYQERTDIWVFGDVEGYRYFQTNLREAIVSKNNIHLELIEKCSNSMQCVILPALDKPSKKPKMKFVERKIYKNDEPEMQLIIVGNKVAIGTLANDIDWIIEKYLDDLEGHQHYEDWWTPWIVERSVSLNIRGPLSRWDQNSFHDYKSLILERQPTYLPDSCKYMTKELWKYKEPVVGNGPYKL